MRLSLTVPSLWISLKRTFMRGKRLGATPGGSSLVGISLLLMLLLSGRNDPKELVCAVALGARRVVRVGWFVRPNS
jgi:hypothetical protein